MNPPTVPPSALFRVARSLVSWWEIPPRSSLVRGDVVRFAHSIATLARQLLAAVNGLNDVPPSWDGPWRIAPAALGSRVRTMVSLSNPDETEQIAESLLEEMLSLLARNGIAEADLRFRRLRSSPVPAMSVHQADGFARTVFERARSLPAHAALIADSYARGFADESSDLDIRLFVETVPSLTERRVLVGPLAEDGLLRQYGDEAYITADQFLWCGRKIDVRYHPIGRVKRALREPFVSGGPIDLLELLEVSRPVVDPEGVAARLCAQVHERACRAREIASASLRVLERAEYRPSSLVDPLEAVVLLLGPGLEYLVRAWVGINGCVHTFPKWMHRIAPELSVQPPNAWSRLTEFATGPWTESTLERRLAEWRTFVDDLIALEGTTGIMSRR